MSTAARNSIAVLAYPPGDDPEQTADEVEALEGSIESLFAGKHFDPATSTWNSIALKSCMSISEEDLTVSKARLLTQWRLEYMTLKADDEQPGAPIAHLGWTAFVAADAFSNNHALNRNASNDGVSRSGGQSAYISNRGGADRLEDVQPMLACGMPSAHGVSRQPGFCVV